MSIAEPLVPYSCVYEPKPGKVCGAACKAHRDDKLAMLRLCAACLELRRAKGLAEQRKVVAGG